MVGGGEDGGGVTHAGTVRPLSLGSAPGCRSPSARFLRWSSWCGLDLAGRTQTVRAESSTRPPSPLCSSNTSFMQTRQLKMKLRQQGGRRWWRRGEKKRQTFSYGTRICKSSGSTIHHRHHHPGLIQRKQAGTSCKRQRRTSCWAALRPDQRQDKRKLYH